MSIGVQNTNAALLALQTLGRLNDAATSGDAAAASSASTSAAASTTASPAIATGSIQGVSADGLGQASASLDRAASITDAALSAGKSVSDLLAQMKTLAGQVQDGSTSGDAANSSLSNLLQQISATISSAGFDGLNLLDGSATPSVTVGAGTSGQVSLAASNLSLGGSVITLASVSTMSTASAAAAVLNDVNTSIENVNQTLGQISDQSRQISAHASFISRLSDVLSASGDSTSTPTSADGAKLMALQSISPDPVAAEIGARILAMTE